MTPAPSPSGIRLSLLDRLTDQRPGSSKEPPLTDTQAGREVEAALCRDLMALLNTRRGEIDIPPEFKEATRSLLTFGILDFTAYNLTSSLEQEKLRESIQRAISQFEPRLERVEVSITEPDPLRPILQFQISALLRARPESEPIGFQVTLNRDSRRLAVLGEQ